VHDGRCDGQAGTGSRLNLRSSEASRSVCERVVASELRLLRIASLCLTLGVTAVWLTVLICLRR